MRQPNGHEQRSADTRARLVAAAIEVFGQLGYEAAGTRELAKQAEVNVSAITYHFGGKAELYLAAAEAIGVSASALIEPAIARLRAASRDALAAELEAAVISFLDVVLDEDIPRSWAMFLARCTAEDDEAFTIIYDRALAPIHAALVDTAAMLQTGEIDRDEIRLRVSSTISALMSFRLLPGFVRRGIGPKELCLKETKRIAAMVRDLMRR